MNLSSPNTPLFQIVQTK